MSTGARKIKQVEQESFANICKLIGDLPQDVIENHALIQRDAVVYCKEAIDNIRSFLLATPYEPDEFTCYGNDVAEIAELLEQIDRVKGLVMELNISDEFLNKFPRRYGRDFSSCRDNTYVLTGPHNIKAERSVLFDREDLSIIKSASDFFDWYGFKSGADMLKAGFIAGIVENGELVSAAYTAALTAKYVNIGIRTKRGFRGRGYATDSAARVLDAVQDTHLIPVWNALDNNTASISICENMGFTKVYEKQYLYLATPKDSSQAH